jgi:hypothetical protein
MGGVVRELHSLEKDACGRSLTNRQIRRLVDALNRYADAQDLFDQAPTLTEVKERLEQITRAAQSLSDTTHRLQQLIYDCENVAEAARKFMFPPPKENPLGWDSRQLARIKAAARLIGEDATEARKNLPHVRRGRSQHPWLRTFVQEVMQICENGRERDSRVLDVASNLLRQAGYKEGTDFSEHSLKKILAAQRSTLKQKSSLKNGKQSLRPRLR